VKHTQRFNKERQTINKLRNKVSTQKNLPKKGAIMDLQIKNRKQNVINCKEACSNLNIGPKTSELIQFC